MSNYYVGKENFNDWFAICKTWCRKNDATLLFVKDESFGYETADGQFVHMYVDELKDILER